MASLQTRVVNILKSPKTEWPVIAGESTDVGTLYRQYIIPLSAIPAVAAFIGQTFVGTPVPLMGTVRSSFMQGLVGLIVGYVLGLVGCYVAAFVIEWLAPKFKSSGSRAEALKLVAYAYTPVWVAGVLNILPLLGMLVLLAGLYSIYLFYLGMTPVMKTPADQVIPYMIVSALVMIVIGIVIGAITAAMTVGSLVAM
jgi:hypothetical protein